MTQSEGRAPLRSGFFLLPVVFARPGIWAPSQNNHNARYQLETKHAAFLLTSMIYSPKEHTYVWCVGLGEGEMVFTSRIELFKDQERNPMFAAAK